MLKELFLDFLFFAPTHEHWESCVYNIVAIDREQTYVLYHEVNDELSFGSVWDSPNEGKSTEF